MMSRRNRKPAMRRAQQQQQQIPPRTGVPPNPNRPGRAARSLLHGRPPSSPNPDWPVVPLVLPVDAARPCRGMTMGPRSEKPGRKKEACVLVLWYHHVADDRQPGKRRPLLQNHRPQRPPIDRSRPPARFSPPPSMCQNAARAMEAPCLSASPHRRHAPATTTSEKGLGFFDTGPPLRPSSEQRRRISKRDTMAWPASDRSVQAARLIHSMANLTSSINTSIKTVRRCEAGVFGCACVADGSRQQQQHPIHPIHPSIHPTIPSWARASRPARARQQPPRARATGRLPPR